MKTRVTDIPDDTKEQLRRYAAQYETREFLNGDPSWFMHAVRGADNQETMAFLASTLSYGSRAQFMPKIGFLLQQSGGETHRWVQTGAWRADFSKTDSRSFYRLYTYARYAEFLDAYSGLVNRHGTLGGYLRQRGVSTGFEAVTAICEYFGGCGVDVIVPKDARSACKRVCMFLRWMVRSDSPVDLGLWRFIDRRTLVMPLDTHVMQQAAALNLLNSKSASMHTARMLSESMRRVFPDDPLKGDFALFGYGVNKPA